MEALPTYLSRRLCRWYTHLAMAPEDIDWKARTPFRSGDQSDQETSITRESERVEKG